MLLIWGPERTARSARAGLQGRDRPLRPALPDLRPLADRAWLRSFSRSSGSSSTARPGACWCAPRRRTARWSRRSASTRNGCSPASSRSASFSPGWAARSNCRARPANHTMDLQVITEALVVVVIGGLGSVTGHVPRRDHRLRAQRLRHPGLSEDLDRPRLPGDGGGADRAPLGTARARRRRLRAHGGRRRSLPAGARSARKAGSLVALALAAAALLPLVAGNYFLGVATEVLIFMLYAASLHFLLAAGGLASFGHAAYFGLGSYGAAIALQTFGLRHGDGDRRRSRSSAWPARLSSAGSACASPASISPC